MQMLFQQLLDGAEVLFQRGNPNITGLAYDSRAVAPGFAFVAMRGETTDGNRYIDAAIAAGAAAIVSDSQQAPVGDIPWAQVKHGRRALARLSANFYKRPAQKLAITGITGTNGKTTTSFLVESILTASGRKAALLGTIEYHIAGKVIPAPHTTPEALEINKAFADALANGAIDAVMEVSSHALAQQRVYGIPFDVGVFTNLTRDHLDYHKTMDDYLAAKSVLFQGCGTEPPRVGVFNRDDENGLKLAQASKSKMEVFVYGLEKGHFRAEKIDVGMNGTRFDLVTPDGKVPIFSPLIGRVNIYNIMAAAAAAYARGCQNKALGAGVEKLARVPGRFERVDCGQPFSVVVDYAHTDDALRNLIAIAREFVTRAESKGRVITLFGCGGDRDKTKRPLMGEAAGTGSDFVVLTSDNPRSEDPQAIIQEALPGLQKTGTKYTVEPDRRKAIGLAISEAHPGDIVLLAGKGHEKMQITTAGSAPFDDVEVAREVLHAAGYTQDAAVRSAQ